MIHALALAIHLNPGQQRILRLLPTSFPVTARDQRGILRLKIDARTHTVTITATGQSGRDIVVLTTAQRRFRLHVRVAPDAGTIPLQSTLRVTGDPLDPTWLWQKVDALLKRVVLASPAAQITIGAPSVRPTPPPAGSQTTVAFPVRITGDPQRFDVSGIANIRIKHLQLDPFTPPLLAYDDDPEQLHANGQLFTQIIDAGQPVRLYSYHQNGRMPRHFVIALRAPGSKPVAVALVEAPAGPSGDVMSVGHATTRDFLLRQPIDEGTIITVVPGIPYIVRNDALGPHMAVAETMDIRVLHRHQRITLSVMTVADDMNIVTGFSSPMLPRDGKARHGIFAIDGLDHLALKYAVGGPDAIVEYGTRSQPPPLAAPTAQGRDLGDYGLLRTVVFRVSNPDTLPHEVYLYEKPLGGIVRSSFLVDGALLQVGCVVEPKEYLITAFELAPKMTYQVVVKTMTDGGSNYPLQIGMGAMQPLLHAPPVRAPNGCFPK